MKVRTWGEGEVQLHSFLTLAMDGGEWLILRPGRFTPAEHLYPLNWRPGGTQNRSGLLGEEKIFLVPTGIRYPDRPAVPHYSS